MQRLHGLLFFSLIAIGIKARPLSIVDKRLENPPPRIIRTCCSFGVDVKLSVIPFVKYSDITGPEFIGPHKYLGSKQEGNGIVYTKNGGFVDIGHLRDQADWTAYLYNLIKKNTLANQQNLQLKLGYEGGVKTLKVSIPSTFSEHDLMSIAGRIAYDLSVWHEIGTWNGTSLVPLLPEKYSAFSIEDGYSNLLGVKMGIEALQSDLPFEQAMTVLIKNQLAKLEVLPSKSDTYKAMMDVEGIWWSSREKLPKISVVKKREFVLYPCVEPVLLDGSKKTEFSICLPELESFENANDYYRIQIELNNKIPVKEIFSDSTKKIINQKDFPALIEYASKQSDQFFNNFVYKPALNRKTRNFHKNSRSKGIQRTI